MTKRREIKITVIAETEGEEPWFLADREIIDWFEMEGINEVGPIWAGEHIVAWYDGGSTKSISWKTPQKGYRKNEDHKQERHRSRTTTGTKP